MATARITWGETPITEIQGRIVPVINISDAVTELVTFTGTSAATTLSSSATPGRQVVHVIVDAAAWVLAGEDPTAVAKTAGESGSGMYLVADTHYSFGVDSGHKLAFVTA